MRKWATEMTSWDVTKVTQGEGGQLSTQTCGNARTCSPRTSGTHEDSNKSSRWGVGGLGPPWSGGKADPRSAPRLLSSLVLAPHPHLLPAVRATQHLPSFQCRHRVFTSASYSPGWGWRLMGLASTAQTSSPSHHCIIRHFFFFHSLSLAHNPF